MAQTSVEKTLQFLKDASSRGTAYFNSVVAYVDAAEDGKWDEAKIVDQKQFEMDQTNLATAIQLKAEFEKQNELKLTQEVRESVLRKLDESAKISKDRLQDSNRLTARYADESRRGDMEKMREWRDITKMPMRMRPEVGVIPSQNENALLNTYTISKLFKPVLPKSAESKKETAALYKTRSSSAIQNVQETAIVKAEAGSTAGLYSKPPEQDPMRMRMRMSPPGQGR